MPINIGMQISFQIKVWYFRVVADLYGNSILTFSTNLYVACHRGGQDDIHKSK